MTPLALLATLIIQSGASPNATVIDGLSEKACLEASGAINRRLSAQEAADADARASEQEARSKAEWARRNPRLAQQCEEDAKRGVWSSACDYRGSNAIVVGSYEMGPRTYARCVKP